MHRHIIFHLRWLLFPIVILFASYTLAILIGLRKWTKHGFNLRLSWEVITGSEVRMTTYLHTILIFTITTVMLGIAQLQLHFEW